MSFFRVHYDGYMEEEFDDADEAASAFIDHLDSVETPDLIVEEWNEETGEWDWT